MKEEILKTHHIIIPDKFEDCEGCVAILALFKKEIEGIIGEDDMDPQTALHNNALYSPDWMARNTLRASQREKLKEVVR